MLELDKIQADYIRRQGWTFDGELVHITRAQFNNYQYTGRMLSDPQVHNIMITSAKGCCLLVENKHFVID